MTVATDLPRYRENLIADEHGMAATYRRAIEQNRQPVAPAGMVPSKAGAFMASREMQRLRMAELFFVSEAMTDLAAAAAPTMPEFTLARHDLPAEYGLIIFEKPIAMNDRQAGNDGAATYIVAASWGPWPDCHKHWTSGALWVTWYTDRDRNLDSFVRSGVLTRAQALRGALMQPELTLENESQIPFSDDDMFDGVPAGARFGVTCYIKASMILRTTWTLMQQETLSEERTAIPPRASVRRLKDRNPELMKVRVITLRRPATASGSEHSDRDYKHRWIVRGHWRQQWYPSRDVHRPVWIAPHIKGPENAPMLGTEKVYAWRK